MLTEKQLEDAMKVIDARMQALNEQYLKLMGEHLRDLGRLTPTDIHRVIQLKRYNANIDAMQREIAKAAKLNAADVEKIFREVAESDQRFAETIFGEGRDLPLAQNEPLQRIIQAQLRITNQTLANLSQTTIESQLYRHAVDVAVTAIQGGTVSYNTAIRHALKQAAVEGLRVKYPNSGLTRRLDTAIRQNILDGVRSLNQDVLTQLGQEFGADGVELSAHALCATDHLPYQGRQFSLKEFEELQGRLKRQIGTWNCKHTAHPILLGISVPVYSDEELEAYRQNSSERITIDGRTHTRYEWTQEQRRLETEVRYQKDIAVAAKASGDMQLRREAQARINDLKARYSQISAQANLIEQPERMAVAGFHKVKTAAELKSAPASLQANAVRGIIDTRQVNGWRQPASHILTPNEIDSLREDIRSIGADESVFAFNVGPHTGLSVNGQRIFVRGDVLPDPTSNVARDRMTSRAALAHEYYGHYSNRDNPEQYPIGDWKDEFRASYDASINTPNLTDEERRDLMIDAYDRVREAGQVVEYTEIARRLIWGYE